MRSFFTKPIDALDADDINGLKGWAESVTLEFKGTIPTKEGRPDPWLAGGKVGDYGRDKLLKEVVAFANTSGGRVVLGIEEERGPPPTAKAVLPIRGCVALAERLLQMAQHIEPPIPLLLVQGVAIEGDAGVVVFDVPASRAAPHRAPDKECYVRRGTESVPVTMREIQDMTFASARRGEWLPARLEKARTEFQEWMDQPSERLSEAVGIMVTGAPAASPFSLPRLFGDPDTFKSRPSFRVNFGPAHLNVQMARNPVNVRSTLRGTRLVYSDQDNPASVSLYSDGCVSVCAKLSFRNAGHPRVYMLDLLPCVLNGFRAASFLRQKAQAPDAEYAFEVVLDCRPRKSLNLHAWGFNFDEALGEIRVPVTLPVVSFGRMAEAHQAAAMILTDLLDASGSYLTDPITFIDIQGL